LQNIPKDYLQGDAALLFFPPDIPHDLGLKIKPFNSVIEKLYRHNVRFNKKWPKDPHGGRWAPENLYTDLDDLLRTRLVCRYLDGPKFVCHRLKEFCDRSGIENTHRGLSTEAGYYAWHYYFRIPVELSIGGTVKTQKLWIEIQLTTQLAEVISSLTHGLYEKRREGNTDDPDWKWEAASPQFRSSFIGHGLHLLEGVIQTFRDDVFRERREQPLAAGAHKTSTGPEGD
jgi:ppGpp synthetase/RelA/SpoT-type nucleotidyltranferase